MTSGVGNIFFFFERIWNTSQSKQASTNEAVNTQLSVDYASFISSVAQTQAFLEFFVFKHRLSILNSPHMQVSILLASQNY